MRLGMGSFTHFTDTQIFSKKQAANLFKKTGVAKGPGLAKDHVSKK